MTIRGRRLSVVINSLGTGGAETQLRGLLPELIRRDWAVEVVSLLEAGAVADDLIAAGITVHSLRLGKRDPRWLRSPALLAEELRSFRPTVLHAHLTQATIVARLARSKTSAQVLVDSVHYTQGEARWRAWAYWSTRKLSDRTSVLSIRARDEQLGSHAVEAEKVVIVPNGIDTGYFVHDRLARDGLRSGLNVKSEFLWITVGRFVEEKDHGALIRALTVVRNSVPQTRLLIVGDGPLTGKIKALVAERNLQDAVILAGSVRDVRPLLSAADGFVLSSEREGLPLALLEAMSMALPVASTNVGSIPDVIADGHGGILVEPRSAEALAAAMLAVQRLSTPDRKAMGAEGRKTVVSRFSVGVIADQWVDIYEQCLTSPRPASLRHH